MKVTVKGQVTVPKAIRQRFGLMPGVEVQFLPKGNHVILEKVINQHPLDKVYGILGNSQQTDRFLEELRGKGV